LATDALVPAFLLSSRRFGVQLSLTRMESLMRRLGNPQDDLSYFHVAGTNGKGSVTAYITSMLASDGHRVGMYTSPYLERFTERIRVLDGKDSLCRYEANDTEGEISSRDLLLLSDTVQEAVRGMLHDNEEHPTEFELVTAVAFLYFASKKCDYVVLETGLGGRLDATNIISKPKVSIITSLGFDHTDVLGKTMRDISFEKAGIIKPGSPVFLACPYDTGLVDADAADVQDVITRVCKERGSQLTVVSSAETTLIESTIDGQTFAVPYCSAPMHIRLIGSYQVQNAALAMRAVLGLVSPEGMREGLARTRWKGRMEVLRRHPLILLDGCHNPAGARSFRDSVDALFSDVFRDNPPILLIGFMEDKDYPQILSILFESLTYQYREIFCVAPDNPRALPAESLKKYLKEHFTEEALFYKNQASMYNKQGTLRVCPNVLEACGHAWNDAKADGSPILCMGSLYLAGQVRGFFIRDREGVTP
jgi:dihydrofolate synthase/folylpolyglutamate synthase